MKGKPKLKTGTVIIKQGVEGINLGMHPSINKNIGDVIRLLRKTECPGDSVVDVSALRVYTNAVFTILTPDDTVRHEHIVRVLRSHDGIVRLHMGEILSFYIEGECHFVIWNHEKNGCNWLSWDMVRGPDIPEQIINTSIRSAKIAELWLEEHKSESRRYRLEHCEQQNRDLLSRAFEEEWSPSSSIA